MTATVLFRSKTDAINFLEDPFCSSEAAKVLYEMKDENPTLHIDELASKDDPPD